MNNLQEKKEHEAVLQDAKEVLERSQENLRVGRERLENALKRYKERSANGPIKHI